ncbi:PREDICTED: uncharacterized protein LOC109184730 [Ipomoea nil]|uniref:uncharacterized protein LOC109184730 n=1 Tax=Ipomoea nil TaxID=35883 RepID=UPI0009009782|nr:PREDICTED: uncharacterized protein LOC109184730 [Ipomoea nil]
MRTTNHVTFAKTFAMTLYFAFVDDLATTFCMQQAQEIKFLQMKKAKPLVNLWSSGHPAQSKSKTVCDVVKHSLYGLKQVPRAWFNRLHTFLISVGFQASKTDVSLFYFSRDFALVYLLVYVDDILLMGSDQALVTHLLSKLSATFKIRDLGEPNFFLGIETVKCDDEILLSQQQYMNDILKHAGIAECKPLSIPISVSKIVPFSADLYDDPTSYKSLAGTLQYLTVTPPDLSFAVNQLCQHMHVPTTSYWEQLKRVLRYVKGIIGFGLRIQKSMSKEIHAFSYSDWVGYPEDRKSTSGFAIFLGTNLISWICKKQRTVARYSTEAEYKVLAYV